MFFAAVEGWIIRVWTAQVWTEGRGIHLRNNQVDRAEAHRECGGENFFCFLLAHYKQGKWAKMAACTRRVSRVCKKKKKKSMETTTKGSTKQLTVTSIKA